MNAAVIPTIPLPWAETFFIGAIQSQHLAHAYVLKGKACDDTYNLALKVAQVINCSNRPSVTSPATLSALACGQCTNCKWVAGNSHPAVLTVSRLTYQVNDKGELMTPEELEKQTKKSQPTQIKTDQIGRLIQQLGVSSEYNRVVIFTDAEELPKNLPSLVNPPFDWRSVEANEEKSFHIRPLQRDIFNAFSVNKFLKTLEEPPPRVLFFFIAETEEKLLDTIVSRCQVVPCVSDSMPDHLLSIPESHQVFLESILTRLEQGQDALLLTGEFESYLVNEAGLSFDQALNLLQLALRARFMASLMEERDFQLYRKAQQMVEDTRRMLDAKTNETQVMLNLFLSLSKQLRDSKGF